MAEGIPLLPHLSRNEVVSWSAAEALLAEGLLPASPLPLVSQNAMVVLERRYLKKDEAGRALETPRALFERVADALAAPDTHYGDDPAACRETFLRMLLSLEFVPNSPTLMNAGRELGQLSACFTLPV